jgi:uncharacterized protein YneF (UPF0154 family)
MRKVVRNEEQIMLVLIGICIGIIIGMFLKTAIDVFFVVENLP